MLQKNQFGNYEDDRPLPEVNYGGPLLSGTPQHDEDPVIMNKMTKYGELAGVQRNTDHGFKLDDYAEVYQKKMFPELNDYKPGPMEMHPDALGTHPDVVHHATFHDEPFARPQEWGVHTGSRAAAEERLSNKTFDPETLASSIVEHTMDIPYGSPEWEQNSNRIANDAVDKRSRESGARRASETPANMFKLVLPKSRRAGKLQEDPGSGWKTQMEDQGADENLAHPYINRFEDAGSISYVAKPEVYMHPSQSIAQADAAGLSVHPAWRGRQAAGHADLPERWTTNAAKESRMWRERDENFYNKKQQELPLDIPEQPKKLSAWDFT